MNPHNQRKEWTFKKTTTLQISQKHMTKHMTLIKKLCLLKYELSTYNRIELYYIHNEENCLCLHKNTVTWVTNETTFENSEFKRTPQSTFFIDREHYLKNLEKLEFRNLKIQTSSGLAGLMSTTVVCHRWENIMALNQQSSFRKNLQTREQFGFIAKRTS